MKRLTLIIITGLVFSLSAKSQSALDYLEGTWQVEGKATYECWKKTSDGSLSGQGYRMSNGQKVVTENLAIKKHKGTFVYEAAVGDQNDGATVPFSLNEKVAGKWQFENPDHDFPTTIAYTKKEADRVFVEVLGSDGKGFSFYMNRQ
mgnify:CR=1 FL=1